MNLQDWTAEFDKAQPRRRKWVHMVADRGHVEFWQMSLESDDANVSSGLLPLFDQEGNWVDGYALRLLIGLFLADPQVSSTGMPLMDHSKHWIRKLY